MSEILSIETMLIFEGVPNINLTFNKDDVSSKHQGFLVFFVQNGQVIQTDQSQRPTVC